MPALSRREFFAVSAAFAGTALTARAAEPAGVSGTIRLKCGRNLAYTEYGNPRGAKAVIHQHSLPGSRREAETFLTSLCKYPDARLISLDRPGFGDSDPVAKITYCGWVPDLAEAADALGASRFALTGFSGGVPFALAAAIALPERITRLSFGCAGGEHRLGRFNGLAATGHRLARCAPRLTAKGLVAFREGLEKDPRSVFNPLRPLVKNERAMIDDPLAVALMARSFLDGLKQGPDACIQESVLLTRPWGLPLCKVAASTTLWHGADDRFAPPWMSERHAKDIPNAVCHLSPSDGHLSLPYYRAPEILAAAIA